MGKPMTQEHKDKIGAANRGRYTVPDARERLWRLVRKRDGDECWQWLGTFTWNGYGQLWNRAGSHLAHRIAYEAAIGPIPPGLVIDHLCGNRGCVNPAHMEVVTPLENTRRGQAGAAFRERPTCKNGHPFDAANTLIKADGRKCRTCRRERVRAWRARQKEQSA